MRDDLSLVLFNSENLFVLGSEGHYPFFTIEFIEVIILAIIQSSNLSINSRIDLCRTGFYSLKNIKKIVPNFKEKNK